MAREVNVVRDMVIDEVSTVDRGAAQHSRIVLAKRATEEITMPEYFTQEGEPADVDSLDIGDVVFDSEGNPFEMRAGEARELEDAGVSKSSPFGAEGISKRGEDSAVASLREALSKAMGDGDAASRETITKAFEDLSKRAERAEEIAKSERDIRLNAEFISKAASYELAGVTPDELGPVMKSLWESESEGLPLPEGTCAVIHKAFAAAGNIFAEYGVTGGGTNSDPFAAVEAQVEGIAKADGTTREAALVSFLRDNPKAYDDYSADRAGL